MEEDAGRSAWEQAQGRLSDEGLAWYREQLNPAFERDHPAEFAALKASVDRALAASGQSLSQEPDGRSIPQQEHDRRYGITYENNAPQLPSDLSNAVQHEAEYQPSDPHETAAALSNIGRSYKDDYQAAARLLQQTGSKADASKLSAQTLANLAIFSDHLARHATGRPQ